MANFDLVFVCDKKAAEEFDKHGLPHPKVRRGNEMPTTADLLWAIDSLDHANYDRLPDGDEGLYVKDLNEGYGIRIENFDWHNKNSIPGEYFTMYGRCTLTLEILIKLCERSGQLLLWPDSGEPPIILDATMDAQEVFDLHCEASDKGPDAWRFFFEQMYGAGSH
jgi:hypothetical protein